MMAGRNQHHIPQFLQRGFGVRRSGKPKEIWMYQKGLAAPVLSEIKRTASEDEFYSPVSDGGPKTLDEQITDLETPLSRKVALCRRATIGTNVDAAIAVEIIFHLAPRTSHLRSVFAYGLASLVAGAKEIFTNQSKLESLLGLDADQPSAAFLGSIAEELANSPFALLGLPDAVLEQVAFRLLKESFGQFAVNQIAQMTTMFEAMAFIAPTVARDGHNKALTTMTIEGSRQDDLLTYSWTIEAAPRDGAILPDCVAIALLEGGIPRPFIGSSRDQLRTIVLPISTDKLLVGVKEGEVCPLLSSFNSAAAGCSNQFYLASTIKHEALLDQVGRFASADVDEGLHSAFQGFEFNSTPAPNQKMSATEQVELEGGAVSKNFSFGVSCFDFGDSELTERIGKAVQSIVAGLVKVIPLGRLDGVTFAANYPAALAAIDRGRPDIPAAKTTADDVGVGVAMTVIVERDGVIKGHIVLNSWIGLGIVEQTAQHSQWALHTLTQELAEVSMVQLFDEAFPGLFLKAISDRYEGSLFVSVNNALSGYAASRISSCVGSCDDTMQLYRELLVSTLAVAEQKVSDARLSYRYDGDLSKLLDTARPLAGHILGFSARLLGHADGVGSPAFDDEGVVKAALERAGLLAWLKTFETDLRHYWDRLGQWQSLDELFRFNRHVERIYWQFGMFWSRDEDGDPRVNIPVAIDAARLLGSASQSVPKPDPPSP